MEDNGNNDKIKKNKQFSETQEDKYRETGLGLDKSKKLSTLDLIYSAILGVLGGFISSLIPFSLLIKVWYPFKCSCSYIKTCIHWQVFHTIYKKILI